MSDIALDWGGDISFSETGDIATVQSADELAQRFVRRALTNRYTAPDSQGDGEIPAEVIWSPTYGGNVRSLVDTRLGLQTLMQVKQRFLSQLQLESNANFQRATANLNVTQDGVTIFVSGTVSLGYGKLAPIPLIAIT